MISIKELCDIVRQTAYEIHRFHGHGHLEKIYQNALVNRLQKQAIQVAQMHPITVHDEDGTELGHYIADLLVENRLIVEIKACKTLTDEHTAQILGYLKSTGIEDGLLINFGSFKFQIKKYIMSPDRQLSS